MPIPPEVDRDELPDGSVLVGGRYVVETRLGRGGVATVYRARDTRTGQGVALKILSGSRAEDAYERQCFDDERRLGVRLADRVPWLVRPLDAGTVPELGGRPYLAMELVEGEVLGFVLIGGPLPVARACAIALGIADALVGLHDHGVIHRDVKPDNIMLEPSEGAPRIRLLDLGYACARGDARATGTTARGRGDERPGTKHYMAPEQALGHPPTPAFDVFALAGTLYHALGGVMPYEGLSAREAVQRKCGEGIGPEPLSTIEPSLPAALVELVEHGLQLDPARRIATVAAFRRRLRRVMAALHEPSKVARGVPSRSRRHGSPGWWVASLLAMALAGSWAWAWVRDEGTDPVGSSPSVTRPSRGDRGAKLAPERPGAADRRPTTKPAREVGPAIPTPEAPAEEARSNVATTPARRTPRVARARARVETSAGAPASASPNDPPSTAAASRAEPPCARLRERVIEWTQRSQWTRVLDATRRTECWFNRDHLPLRLEALYRTGDYERCARLAERLSAPHLQRIGATCRAKSELP